MSSRVRRGAGGSDAQKVAREVVAECRRAGTDAVSVRSVRRVWSKNLQSADPRFVLDVVREVLLGGTHMHRVLAYELLASHNEAFGLLDDKSIEALGRGLSDWGSIDLFGVTIVGPAWREGLISDSTIRELTQSADRWQRRLALVATVPLNIRSRGGTGDPRRTLAVCRRLLGDRDPMVVKALSWALRELAKREPAIVADFVEREHDRLAALVRREVANKLRTGLKSGRVRRPEED